MSTQGGLRAIAYVRVSAVMGRTDLVSPEIQLESIKRHCESRGYSIVETLEDLDLSGKFWKRRQVNHAVEMIEAKQADVLVVWKISRVSRNRMDWNIAVDRVESIGGRIESATEPMDTSTSSGRFARGMLAELAVFESERIGESWKETHARRIARGLPANGLPRFGYDYSRESGFTPNPVSGPVLAEMYRRYIAGISIYSLTFWAQSTGAEPVRRYNKRVHTEENLWQPQTIRSVMDTGFGAGKLRVKGEYLPGAQEPVITENEWAEYLSRREVRGAFKQREGSPYMLSGIARCHCGFNMMGRYKGTSKEVYCCTAVLLKRAHKGGFVRSAVIHRELMKWLESVADEINESAAKALIPEKVKTGSATARLERELVTVTNKLDKLTVKFLEGVIPQDTYSRLLIDLEGQKEALSASLRAAKVSELHPATELVPELLASWQRLSVDVRRDILSRLLDHITVTSGNGRSTVEIVPKWESAAR